MSLSQGDAALEDREHDTLPPEAGSHVSVHPDEDTGKELGKFDDLIKGLPALADQVAHLAAALPELRTDIAEILEMKPQIALILKLIRESVDAGIEAAAGHAEVKHLYEEQEARMKHYEHEMAQLRKQLSGIACLNNLPCPGGNSSTIPAPPSGV